VLESLKDKELYTGHTGDLKKRFKEHNEGLVDSTRARKPFKLIYYEAYLDKSDARRREKYLKTGMGKRDLKNRLRGYLRKERKV
jgi:putative endonuclease